MNDDPKWDELEQYIRDIAAVNYNPMPPELKLNLGPQVEADDWPEIVE
jgi:hypothetical protein